MGADKDVRLGVGEEQNGAAVLHNVPDPSLRPVRSDRHVGQARLPVHTSTLMALNLAGQKV